MQDEPGEDKLRINLENNPQDIKFSLKMVFQNAFNSNRA